jgi:disulfide bond formation protein DsbB
MAVSGPETTAPHPDVVPSTGAGWAAQVTPRLVLVAIAVIGAAMLAAAFVMQWGFGVRPCILCLYERVPYAAVVAIAVAGLLFAAAPQAQRWLIRGCGVVFTLGALLAAYHVGVENHWWVSAVGCEVKALPTFSVQDLRTSALTPLKPCDEVDFRVLGLSLAGWNAVASAVLAAACCVAAARLPLGRGDGR